MQTPIPNWRKCAHCGKTMSAEEYIRTGNCPSCKKSVYSAPTPEKGEFIDPNKISQKEMVRIDDWAIKIMSKHEHLFSDKIPIGKIFVQEALKPEDVDISQVYDFRNLHYQIYRKNVSVFAIRIMQGSKMLIDAGYTKT